MLKALVKIAQLATADVLLNHESVPAGRELYCPGALQLKPGGAPVLVNHEDHRKIGRVLALYEFDDTDGRWCVARCAIDEPPEWLCRGSSASMAWAALGTGQEMPSGWTRFTGGLVTEVSLLPPGVRPAEPRAKVVLLRTEEERASSPAAVSTSDRAVAGEVILGGHRIVRHGVGKVLAVGGRTLSPVRRIGRDVIVEHGDGSATIYSGPDAEQEALRDGVAV